MSRRAVYAIGGIAVAGGGYYLYSAGGNPKTAGKLAERTSSPFPFSSASSWPLPPCLRIRRALTDERHV